MEKITGIDITMALEEEARKNIFVNLKRGLPDITDSGDWREAMPIAICGSGPSLLKTLDELRKFRWVMAAGSSHDVLIENDIYPDWCVLCDPDPVVAKYLTKPIEGCKYLVASVCDKAVFDALEDFEVFLWHMYNDDEKPGFWDGHQVSLIGGGCTVATRSMMVAMGMGFSNQHFFGMDSCIWPDAHHAYGEFKDPNEKLGDVFELKLGHPEARTFQAAGYQICQLHDFKTLIGKYAYRLQVTVHGDGALAELIRLGKDIGHAQNRIDGPGRSG